MGVVRDLPKPELPRPESLERKKPKTVTRAEYALMTWTAWTCFFGIYQTWTSIPDVEKAMTEQLQGMVSIPPEAMMQYAVGGYTIVAIVSVLFIYAISKGKKWARSSFMVSFVCEAISSVLWVLISGAFGISEGWRDYLGDIPDYGLQIYALYLLYTWPGERWFEPPEPAAV